MKYIIIGMVFLLVGILGFVNAQGDEELTQDVPFSFESWFRHLFGLQDFSIVGDYRQCDRYPERTFTYEYGEAMYVDSADYCDSGYGLINFFTSGWNPVSEKRDDISISSCNVPPCHIEVYCCPFDECDDDNDCEDWYGSGSECKSKIANDPNINYEYSTFKYCTEPSEIQVTCWYSPESGESCSSRTYIGDEYCPSTYMSYILYESKSTCEGNIPREPINGNGEVPIDLDAVIYDIKAPTSVIAGEEVIVEFKVKNNGDTGDYLLEAGIIPKETADAWGFKYGILDWLGVQFSTECCEGQPNIFAKTTQLKTGEIDIVKIKIPKAPYDGIRDLCQDNVYWNGTGEYVLYITMKTGCWPEGKEVTYETRTINVGGEEGEEGEAPTKATTLTWGEYYSTDDLGIIEDGAVCLEDSDCGLKQDYKVSCVKTTDTKDRIWKGQKEWCKSKAWVGHGILGGLISGIVNLIIDPCAYFADLSAFITKVFKGTEPGICIAESTTWYGKLWDGALKMVGGMGLPAQYVVIITALISITLAGVIIKFATGK